MNYKSLFISIVAQVTELINSPAFLQAYRFPNRFVRKGQLTMTHVILYLLNSTRQAMHQNLERICDIEEIGFPDVTRQAVSKARQGIMPSLFEDLFNLGVEKIYQAATKDSKKLWRNTYDVFAVDGSRFQLPRSVSNFKKFGEMFSKDDPKRRWSTALVSTIYDVCNDIIVHGLIMPYQSSERHAARIHCEKLENTGILHKLSIILFDRGYYSEDMFRYFSGKGYLCVMRLKEGINLTKDCDGDTRRVLPGNPDNGTADIIVRVIRVDLGNGTIEYLGTNIFDESLSEDDFKELYFMRWELEGKYWELKTQFKIEEFNGCSSVSVEQEFFITLLLSNLVSLVKTDADKKIKASENPENKYHYQSNRAFIIGRIKEILVPVIIIRKSFDVIDRLFKKAEENRSQVQPDRVVKRNTVKKDRTHFFNRKAAAV